MDADQRCAQAQHESRQTPREDAPTGWRKKERLPVELRSKVKKNEGDETARTGRNGGEATSDRSQSSSGAGPSQHTSGNREISFADNFSARRRFTASTPRAEGEGKN